MMRTDKHPVPMFVDWHFDGHGINDHTGQRICKVQSCEPYIYPTGMPERNKEFDRLSNLIAAAPELLEAVRHAHIYLVQSCDAEKRELADEMWAAIAKAEGRQP